MKTDFTLSELLKWARQQLQATSDSAALDAELLLCHCLCKPRSYLFTWPETTPNAEQQARFHALIQQRMAGIPVAYLIGEKEFWSLPFTVNAEVLIPRVETELLVKLALEKIGSRVNPMILELGTGSGAIAVALAIELPQAEIIATDLSPAALQIARQNAQKLAANNIHFQQSDWFDTLDLANYRQAFDLILSNPPYIANADPHLTGDIRYEPLNALASGVDGLDAIRTLCANAKAYLKSAGWLMFEHGYDQGQAARTLLSAHAFKAIETYQDYAGNDRISLAACATITNNL